MSKGNHWPTSCKNLKQWLLVGLFCVPGCFLVFRAFAQDPQPGVLGHDDRRVIDQRGAPWAAIGQVNATGYRRLTKCTGSLIAANLVITAAHCVMNPWHRRPFPLDQIHFVAGVTGSDRLGHSTARCLHFPPDYKYVGPDRNLSSLPFQHVPRRAFVKDVVLIVLKNDLDNVAPLKINLTEDAGSDLPLVHASYAADRRYRLTGHFGCHLLVRDQDLWLTDCDTQAASSGGPVFVQKKEDLQLAAIMVGVATDSASIAVPASSWLDLVAKRDCP